MRTLIYGRESRDKKTSVRSQIAAGEQWCADEQHEIVATYRDGSSASRFASKSRSDWTLILADVKAGRAEQLWLWESSRGDRTLETWAAFLTACREHNVLIRVESHDRTYNMANWRDWRSLADDGVDSATESEKLSARSRRGVKSNALEGRPHGRNQYGYQRHYDEFSGNLTSITIREDQAAVLREAASRFMRGETLYGIARDFNARGITTPRYGRWTKQPLERLLAGPFVDDGSALADVLREAHQRAYRGEDLGVIAADFQARELEPPPTRWTGPQLKEMLVNRSYNGKRQHNGQIVADAVWPAIFDDDTFARLVAKLCDPARVGVRDATIKHLLSGIIRCGKCGGRMRVLMNRGKQCYQCIDCYSLSRNKAKVDKVVERAIVRFLERPDCREILAPPESGDGRQDALAEIEALRARLDGFYEQAGSGDLSPAGLARVEKRLLADIETAKLKARPVTVAPVLELLIGPDAAQTWDGLSITQQREAITELIVVQALPVGAGKRIFDPASVHIEWRHELWGS